MLEQEIKEYRKAEKFNMMTLGKESFVLGLILILVISYFTFVFTWIPVFIITIISFIGIIISIMQLLRKTHAMAIAGFLINSFVFVFSLWQMAAGQ